MGPSFVSDVAHTLGSQALGLSLALANGAVLAATLGPFGRGQLSVALLMRAFLDTVLNAGQGPASAILHARLGLPTVVAAVGLHTVGATLVGSAAVLAFVGSGAANAAFPGVPPWAILVAAAPLPASLLAGSAKGLLLGMGRLRRVNAINVVEIATTLALNLLLLPVLRLGLLGALLASLAATAFSALLCALTLRAAGASLSLRWDAAALRSTLSFGAAAHVANLAQWLSYRADLFLVAALLGPREAGLYAVATSVGEILWYLPNATASTVFSRTAARPAEPLPSPSSRSALANLAAGVVLSILLAIGGRPLLELVYSPAFQGAYPALLALLPGLVAVGASKVLAAELAGRGHLRRNAIASLIGSLTTVSLDLVLIPRLGILGAAIASSGAYLVMTIATVAAYAQLPRLAQKERSTSEPPMKSAVAKLERLIRVLWPSRRMQRYAPADYWTTRFQRYGFDIRGVADVDLPVENNESSYAAASVVLANEWKRAGVNCARVSLLDVGCGQGHHAELFKASGGLLYTGVDITDVLFPTLAVRFPGFRFEQLDVTKEELPGMHDVILMLDVTHHLVSDDEFRFAMANVQRHLSTSGLFMVTAILAPRRIQLALHCVARPLSMYGESFGGYQLSEPIGFRDKHLLVLHRPRR